MPRATCLPKLHQALWCAVADRGRRHILRIAPAIDIRHLMHAGDGTARGAALSRAILAPDIVDRVLQQRFGGIAPLLGAVMDQPVFTNIEVPAARAAAPVV